MTVVASCLSCLVVLATASTSLPSPAVVTSSARSLTSLAPAPDRIEVDATEIGTLSPAALEEIATQATAEAAKHGIAPDQLRITLVVIDHLDVIRGVRVSIVTPTITLADPDGDPRGPLVARCQACGEEELKTVSIEGVLEALTRFEQARAEAEAAAEAEAEPTAPAESEPAPEPAPPPDEQPRPPLRPLGWAGVTTLALGASALIVGVTFVALGDQRSPARLDYAQDYVRHYRVPGFALVGVGGALAISGAVMLGIERRRSRASTLAITPQLSPTTAGLHLRARF